MEVSERVELGWTGPRERREAAKSGSRASSEIAIKNFSFQYQRLYHRQHYLHSSLISLACGVGWTVGPTAGVSGGTDAEAGLSEMGGGGTLVGNWRRAAPVAAVLAAFEAELPISTASFEIEGVVHRRSRVQAELDVLKFCGVKSSGSASLSGQLC